MSDKDLVSIITPCYNGERYVKNFLDSILGQDYPAVEIIFVDDGSTDNTRQVVLSYLKKYGKRGYCLRYFYQKNGGQASAINIGLPLVRGSYVMWMDSDDILMSNALSKKVNHLVEHPEFGFNICRGYIVDSENLDIVRGVQKRNHDENDDNLFLDLLDERNVVFTPAAYMVRTSILFKAIPKKRIYENREGQNWQLLLPLAHIAQYGYVDEPLYKYVVHKDSHSRTKRSYSDRVRRFTGFQELQIATINDLGLSSKETKKWIRHIEQNINRSKMELALTHFHLYDWFILYKNEYSLKYLIEFNPLFFYIGKIVKRLI